MQNKSFKVILISLLIFIGRSTAETTYPRLFLDENNSGVLSSVSESHRNTIDHPMEKIRTKLNIKDLYILNFTCVHNRPIQWIFECPRVHSGDPPFFTQKSFYFIKNGDTYGDLEYQADLVFTRDILSADATNFSCSDSENRSASILFLEGENTIDKSKNKLSFYFQDKIVNSGCQEFTSIEATMPSCPVYINFDIGTRTYECSNSTWKAGYFDCRHSLDYCMSLLKQDRLNRECLRQANFGKKLKFSLHYSEVIECSLELNGKRIANVFALLFSIPEKDSNQHNLYTSLDALTWDQTNLKVSPVVPREPNEFHIGETVKFQCSGFDMIFSKAFRWGTKYADGSEVDHGVLYPTSVVKRGTVHSEIYNTFRDEVNFEIDGNISEIHCSGYIYSVVRFWVKTIYFPVIVDSKRAYITNFTVYETGHMIYFKCNAAGNPEPAIEIKLCKVEAEVSDAPKVSSCEQLNPKGKFSGHVIIPNTLVNGKTHAVCEASNSLGSVLKTFELSGNPSQTADTKAIAENDNSFIHAMFGIIAVFFVVGVIIIFGIFGSKRRKRQSKTILLDCELQSFFEGTQQPNENIDDPFFSLYLTAYNRNFEISSDDIKLREDILGSGQFGIVVKGSYNGNTVAVKTLRDSPDILYLKALLKEIQILSFVGHHKNIVNLIGACTEKAKKMKVMLVMDYCEIGCLLKFLRSCRPFFMDLFENPEYKNTEWEYDNVRKVTTKDLVRFSCEVADAMTFIAAKNIMHGDIAARNVLVTADISMKLCDFGLSKQMSDYQIYVQEKQIPMPVKWMAVESLKDLKFSIESDAWAYGILLWEIFSLAEVPYSGVEWGFDSWRILESGYRMEKPQHANVEIYHLMKECWRLDPKERLKFRDILEILHNIAVYDSKTSVSQKYIELED